MKNRYGLIYEDAMKLIKKHETRDPELILKNRNVNLLPFVGETHALGMYVIIKRNVLFSIILPLMIILKG